MNSIAEEAQVQAQRKDSALPPTPPETVVDGDDSKSEDISGEDLLSIPLPPPTQIPTKVLDVDKPTPDSHVPRDPRLIRLTGVHPFNVEAPLTDLFNEGFLTSPELFYVRNHGAVPVVQEEDIPNWEFTVEGYVIFDRNRIYTLKIIID
jgi:nitrate reductase (NAD(P)H)